MNTFNPNRIHHQPRSLRLRNTARTLRKTKTSQEAKLWRHLRNEQLGVKFRRQYLIANQYIADFVCLEKKLIIEIDGSQHADNTADKQRTLALKKRGFKMLRFWNNQIDQHLDACLEEIFQYVHGKIV